MPIRVTQTRAMWSSFYIPQQDNTKAISRRGAPSLTPESQAWLMENAGPGGFRFIEVASENAAIVEIEKDSVAAGFRKEMCTRMPEDQPAI
jgi:hypothetical protein